MVRYQWFAAQSQTTGAPHTSYGTCTSHTAYLTDDYI